MNSFSINFLVVLFVAALATLGWFGFQQLELGTEYVVLEESEPLPEVEIEPEPEEVAVIDLEPEPEPEPEISAEVAEIIRGLEALIEAQVIMRDGSSGTRVGVVQKFLNEYLDRSDRIDNAYGPGTAARIRDFQRAYGLSADGVAGPSTYQKMIDVLESGQY